MAGLNHGLLLMFVWLVLSAERGHGQCPVNPDCQCEPRNNSNVICNGVFTGEIPKFSPTEHVYFQSSTISGYGITSIAKAAFEEFPVKRLTIANTRISEIRCQDFAGLGNSLTFLSITSARITSVPTCALANLKKLTSFTMNNNRIPIIRRGDYLNITSLENLNLLNNYIEKIEPEAFSALQRLTTINLYGNKIVKLDDLPFKGLSSLTSLNLQRNKISKLPVRLFDNLKNLQRLYVDYNLITDIEDALFSPNTNLEYIYLGSNQLSTIPEKLFTGLDKLRTFSVHHNRLTDLPMKLFEGCPNLNQLDVSSNLLTYLKPELLRPLTKLRTLQLQNNRIASISDDLKNFIVTDAFRYLASISSINLQNNSLSKFQPGAFRNLTSLNSLYLSQNKLTAIPEGLLTNSSRIQYLYLDNNHIRSIPRDFFEQLSYQLRNLYLDNNQISTSSIIHLFERISSWTLLRSLRLSDTKLPPLSADTMTAFERLTSELRLSNCSLNGEFLVDGNSLPTRTDLSNNNLTGFAKNTPVKVIGSSIVFNVSNNSLNELNVNVSSGRWINIYAENNDIQNLTVAGHNTLNVYSATLLMRKNLISTPVRITTNFTSINLLDLAYNRFTSVESPPVNFTQTLDPCALQNVSTLNLSRNAIHHVSPEACLGGVDSLDLSYNQLQTLGALIPMNRDSDFRLRSLYLAGNRLHAVSPETLLAVKTLQFLDLRSNQFVVVPDVGLLQKLLSNSPYARIYLSGNPLRCDCSSAWLRYGSILRRIDQARCLTPPDKELFLLGCYDVEGCETNGTSTSVSPTLMTLCREDSTLAIRNATADAVGDGVVIHWSVQGPGIVTGFRLTYEDNAGSEKSTEKLYHSEERSAILSDLQFGHNYNVCIMADVYLDSRTDSICMDVDSTAIVHPAGLHVETMALGIALGVSMVIIIGLVACLVIKSKRNVKKQGNESVVRQNHAYAHAQRQKDTPSDGSLYENVI